jgi:hypothetical protein
MMISAVAGTNKASVEYQMHWGSYRSRPEATAAVHTHAPCVTAFGITNMVNTLAGGLGVFVAGYLKSGFGLDGVFAGVAGILALDSVMLFAGYYFWLRKDLRASGVIP